MSRNGQSNLRKKVLKFNSSCEATGFSKSFCLDCCHIKNYSVCDDKEKNDAHNILLLMSNIHRAFDAGFISFDEEGKILISHFLEQDDLMRIGITGNERIRLGGRRPYYLSYHRDNIFKK